MPAKTTRTKKDGTQRTILKFTGLVTKTEIVSPKDTYNGVQGGGLNVTLRIDMPEPPKEPGNWSKPGREPDAPTKAEDETDAAFAKRKKFYEAEHRIWEKECKAWNASVEEYERELADLQGRQLQYAQLVGVGALLGRRKVTVTIQPQDQDLLPGFGATLMESDRLALGSGGEDDDEGLDD